MFIPTLPLTIGWAGRTDLASSSVDIHKNIPLLQQLQKWINQQDYLEFDDRAMVSAQKTGFLIMDCKVVSSSSKVDIILHRFGRTKYVGINIASFIYVTTN